MSNVMSEREICLMYANNYLSVIKQDFTQFHYVWISITSLVLNIKSSPFSELSDLIGVYKTFFFPPRKSLNDLIIIPDSPLD